jgi:salicylate hydroxylase/6-hydroxynicotinate 3-monooxygenase
MLARKDTSIAIIGAGIGGLALAAALRKTGRDATVYEQTESFARIGAGIQQSPNAMKVHRGLGLEDRLRQVAFAPSQRLSREAKTGKVTNDYPWGKTVEERFGADGVHSLARDYVSGPEQPRFTGRLAYRTTYPATLLRGVKLGTASTKWWGKDRHIVIYYVTRARDEIYFTTSQPEKADWMTRESWSMKGDLEEMRAAFRDFHYDVQAVLAAAPEVHKWGIYEREPLPAWSKGRVALLGDACHPMTPYMASGAAMALEDAVVLARCLDDEDCDSPEAAFIAYEAARKTRTSVVQAGSAANTWMRSSETDPAWLYGYDAWRVPLRDASNLKYDALTWEA